VPTQPLGDRPDSSQVAQSLGASDVSAVVCSMNSISGIRECLTSLRQSGVEEIIVVDASSTDGTKEVALELADLVVNDPGTGLGRARNAGVEKTTKPLILNMGSDNVMPDGELQKMIDYLVMNNFHGVSAQTVLKGDDWISSGLNTWRQGRFPEGEVSIIGTPTLFLGDLLRSHAYDHDRAHSDDSELCERWAKKFNARFGISDATSLEVGKATWTQLKARCRNYGVSDAENYANGRKGGWSATRRLQSVAYPFKKDFLTPLSSPHTKVTPKDFGFLSVFTSLRYWSWAKNALKPRS
jgi:glycosyltransferase involved in cell wall biosynthesis